MSQLKVGMGLDVLTAARQRIAYVFDNFPRIYVSFSGGKDSTVMLHLVMEEAIRRSRKIGVLFIDLEGMYKLTIDHIQRCLDLYRAHIDPYWVCLPIHLRNAVSQFESQWICWEPGREKDWIRPLPKAAIHDQKFFPFFRYKMEFEEFVPEFGHWFGGDQLTACFVGIRTDESLNRYRTLTMEGKACFESRHWTTWIGQNLYNIYPIYDWRVEDIWTYHGKTGKPHNGLYDLMHKAGLTLSQMRICQPYGDDQRRGLWLFHLIEPDTWAKVVARVCGANSGALYVQESGNILGYRKITRPAGHTWKSFARMLLESMPPKTRSHYENKIAVFIKWWEDRGFPRGIPDESDAHDEAAKKVPSWRRICKALLRNDYWCKGLSFSQHKSKAFERYRQIMARRRKIWDLQSWKW